MRSVVKSVVLFVLGLVSGLLLVWAFVYFQPFDPINPLAQFQDPVEPPLAKYSFPSLREYQPQSGTIELDGVINQEDAYTAYLFHFGSEGKKVSGQLNKPKIEGRLPVVVMLRGYVNREIYQTGVGTRNAAAVFAANGFVTIAPDFLGYGQSDPEDFDSFAARVERPVTVLNLLEEVKKLDYINPEQIFIWGHSNGGQIGLSVLQITGANYPTTLWAPVTKPFPYSILYYTDTYSDYGKAMRHSLAVFEEIYDVDEFSIRTYLDWIQAPIQLHQGGRDDAVPQSWSDEFAALLRQTKGQDYQLNYYVYPSADHNLRPDWNTVVARDLEFFRKYL